MKALFTAIVLSATLAASGASAQGSNLSGRWQCMAQCIGPPGGFAFITQNGWDLNIVNDGGMAQEPGRTIPAISGLKGCRWARFIRPTATPFSSRTARSGSALRYCRRRLRPRRLGITIAIESNGPSARSASLGLHDRPRGILAAAGRYLVMMGRVVAGGAAAAGEIESVSHAFQPVGRSDPANSP